MRWLGASTRPAARFGSAAEAARRVSGEFSATDATPTPGGRSLPSSRGSPGCVQYAPRRAPARCPRPPRGRGRGRLRVQARADRRTGADLPDHRPRRGRSPDHARAPAVDDPRARSCGRSDSQEARCDGDAHPAGRARLAAARAASRPPDPARPTRRPRRPTRSPGESVPRPTCSPGSSCARSSRARHSSGSQRATRSPAGTSPSRSARAASSSPAGSRARRRRRVFVDLGYGYSIARDTLLATLIRDAGGRLVGATAAAARRARSASRP